MTLPPAPPSDPSGGEPGEYTPEWLGPTVGYGKVFSPLSGPGGTTGNIQAKGVANTLVGLTDSQVTVRVAATPFTITGGITSRTLDDRFADIKNVKDFGATGDGTTDDTAAIQATVDWTSAANRGTIYFPPGTYKVTSAITFNYNGALSIRFRGEIGLSTITGNFAGYILDRNLTFNPTSGPRVIEGLAIVNTNAAGGGIRLGSTVTGAIRDCNISAFQPVSTFDVPGVSSSQSVVIENCLFAGLGGAPVGSIGVAVGANCAIICCDFSGFDEAIRAMGFGLTVLGCRIEVNRTGLYLGKNQAGTTVALSGSLIASTSMEANDTAILCNALGTSVVAGVSIIGSNGSPSGGSVYGIRIDGDDKCSNCTFSAIASAGGFSNSAFKIGASGGGGPARLSGNVFLSCVGTNTGTVWSMPGDASVSFINCNNPTAACVFANLPGTPIEGQEADITNSNTAVWGAIAAGGGATHARVRYNGTNWTVVGI